jgi:hypothetical protein
MILKKCGGDVMSSCGNCGSCGGCDRSLTITEAELEVLSTLAQVPFLPIGRRMDDCAPVYLEEQAHTPEEYTLILQCLEKKGLISLDFDKPLKNADYSRYAHWPIHGSMALTQRGQQVIELMDLQGTQ